MGAGNAKQAGFTLIELLVAIAIVAILATIAVPNLQSAIERNKVAADYNEILAVMKFARSEAVKLRKNAATNVSTGSSGWVANVKVDTDDDGDLSDEDVVRSARGGDDGVAVTSALVQFNSLGRRDSCSVSPCRVDVGGEVMEVNIAGNIVKVN